MPSISKIYYLIFSHVGFFFLFFLAVVTYNFLIFLYASVFNDFFALNYIKDIKSKNNFVLNNINFKYSIK